LPKNIKEKKKRKTYKTGVQKDTETRKFTDKHTGSLWQQNVTIFNAKPTFSFFSWTHERVEVKW